MFTCDLEACTRSLTSKKALYRHKLKSHAKLMMELEKMDPSFKFSCSCGRSFRNYLNLYNHQKRNPSTHPDFELPGQGQACDFCGEFVKLSNVLEHLSGHVGAEYVVKCPNFKECGHAFTHSKGLLGHMYLKKFGNCKKICDEQKLGLKCETCGYTANLRIKLSTHLANEHERGTLPKNLKCPISGCGKMFAVKQSIFLHLHVHRRFGRKTKQSCDRCGGARVEDMEEHLKDKHGISEVIGCKQCPLKFGERDEWVEHLHKHKDSGLSCDICGGGDKPVKYLKYAEFRDHYWGIHKLCPKKYKCGDCENKWFWRKVELTKHNLVNHRKDLEFGVDKKKNTVLHMCDICNVSFVEEITLLGHKIKMHGADPFKCDICGETFHEKTKFSRHQKEHAGVVFQKEWKCEVEGCGRTFKSKKSWKHHVEGGGHGGDKQHVCEECGKGYTLAINLRQHRDTVHLGLRPWVCDECGESFGARNVLKSHKRIHTGERPFGCDICGQRFRHVGVLKTHLKGHQEKGADFKPNGPMKQIRKRKFQT